MVLGWVNHEMTSLLLASKWYEDMISASWTKKRLKLFYLRATSAEWFWKSLKINNNWKSCEKKMWKDVKHVGMNCKIENYLFLCTVYPVKSCLVIFANVMFVLFCEQMEEKPQVQPLQLSYSVNTNHDKSPSPSMCALILIDYHVQKISFYVL